jgi:hypothetical protein
VLAMSYCVFDLSGLCHTPPCVMNKLQTTEWKETHNIMEMNDTTKYHSRNQRSHDIATWSLAEDNMRRVSLVDHRDGATIQFPASR